MTEHRRRSFVWAIIVVGLPVAYLAAHEDVLGARYALVGFGAVMVAAIVRWNART